MIWHVVFHLVHIVLKIEEELLFVVIMDLGLLRSLLMLVIGHHFCNDFGPNIICSPLLMGRILIVASIHGRCLESLGSCSNSKPITT